MTHTDVSLTKIPYSITSAAECARALGLLIHAGNTAKDTKGCILVGMNTRVGCLTDSRKYLKIVVGVIEDAENRTSPW